MSFADPSLESLGIGRIRLKTHGRIANILGFIGKVNFYIQELLVWDIPITTVLSLDLVTGRFWNLIKLSEGPLKIRDEWSMHKYHVDLHSCTRITFCLAYTWHDFIASKISYVDLSPIYRLDSKLAENQILKGDIVDMIKPQEHLIKICDPYQHLYKQHRIDSV